jgi:hypothetical protein
MAAGRWEGESLAAAAALAAALAGTAAPNPYRPPAAPAAGRAGHEDRKAWAAMDAYFGGMKGEIWR